MKFEKPIVLVDKFELVDTIASSGGGNQSGEDSPQWGREGTIAYGAACLG